MDALRGFKHGRTLEDLAKKLGVSERTVRRDLQELADADVRVELSRVDGRAAARLLETSYSGVPVTRRERYTLLAARRVFDVLRGTSFHEDAVSVLSKFEQTMSASERKEHGALGQHFAYVPDGGTKAYEGKEDLIDALQTGILSRKIVRFSYKDSRRRARRGDLAPFVILMYRQGLYVVGARVGEGHASPDLRDWRKGLGVFAVVRFVEAEHLRKRTFEIPEDFRIDDVLHGAFGVHVGDLANRRCVVLEFAADKAELVAGRVWHPTQELTRIAGGQLRLTFTCTNMVPVVSWVLQWGPHVRVIEPPELVDAVVDELDRARLLYAARG
ncbi:MAG: WYL domain-containing protein [Deltaproteobacteria bacterium]|nr:WYL domain-containing protein [Deltaproteobacteria bacterium]